LAAGRNP
jgi:hypothetical protein